MYLRKKVNSMIVLHHMDYKRANHYVVNMLLKSRVRNGGNHCGVLVVNGE